MWNKQQIEHRKNDSIEIQIPVEFNPLHYDVYPCENKNAIATSDGKCFRSKSEMLNPK